MKRTERHSAPILNRRHLLQLGAGSVLVSATPLMAGATPADVRNAQIELFGDRPIREGRVRLKLPPIAENGYSVPLDVEVDSPMANDNYVKQIVIFSPRNPLPVIAQYHLTRRSGRAAVSTRIRLGGTQTVQAVAEMSDGSLWSGTYETVVTLAACVVM